MSSDQVKVTISAELLAELESAERTDGRHPNAHVWSEEEDEALRRFWPTRNKAQVASALGVSYNTCLKRYRELVVEEGKTNE